MRKWMLGVGIAVSMLGMASAAQASGHWWYCDADGSISENGIYKGATFITGVFYSSEMVYASDFDDTFPPGFYVKTANDYRCLSYSTEKKAKHSRNKTISISRRYGAKIIPSGFDG